MLRKKRASRSKNLLCNTQVCAWCDIRIR
jgi:hypothetical protein